MSTDNISLSTCANCGNGEEESGHLKKCGACEMVKYCNAECQKAHRPQHKKECRLRAAELHDEKLFKSPPQLEDCPICFLRMPSLNTGWRYMSCCGKTICSGCGIAGVNMEGNADQLCPFCRAPAPSSEEAVERLEKRIEVGDAQAMFSLGCCYNEGSHGLPQDHAKALELWCRAGKFGIPLAHRNAGVAYFSGIGVVRDRKKAKHHWELAAMGGDPNARNNLGAFECSAGNMNRALKHFMIAVGSGNSGSLMMVQQLYKDGHATKDDYAKALKAYQAYLDEIKSDDRDKAAAFDDEYKYYE